MATFEEQLDTRGFLCYTNKGVSMMPLLRHDRDIMIIYKQTSDFKKNDAVLFKRPNGQYVLHRITKVHGDGLYTIIGDNCIGGEVVPEQQILGVLREVKRGDKTVHNDDFWYRVYVFLLPVRRVWLRFRESIWRPIRRFLGKVYHTFVPREEPEQE